MKNILKTTRNLALATLLASSFAYADSSFVNYQGVAFNSGSAVASTNIALRFTIYQSDGSTVVYQETKSSVTTTDKGFFSHQIGSGTRTAGAANYASVVWADDYKLKVEVDYANGTAYTDLGIQEFSSSVYAKKLDGVTSTTTELNYTDGVTSAIQTQLNGKFSTSGGTISGATTINGDVDIRVTSGSPTLYVQSYVYGATDAEIIIAGSRTAANDNMSRLTFYNNSYITSNNGSDYTLGQVIGTADGNYADKKGGLRFTVNNGGSIETALAISYNKAATFSSSVTATSHPTSSDKRIKENIEPLKDSIAIINKLKPSSYTKIDKVKNGDKINYGFIAQELEEVLPDVVTISKGEIPVLKSLDDVVLEDGVEYKLFVDNGKEVHEQTYKKGQKLPDGKIIVHSKIVPDFRTVDYDMVFTIAVSAIKEQQKQIEKLVKELEQIKKELNNSKIKAQ
jgi:hypothetical protein